MVLLYLQCVVLKVIMENFDEIVGWTYEGDKNDIGLPHGTGTMIYSNKFRPLLKYVGEFVHGVRQGKGTIYSYAPHPELENPIDEYAWYSMGDYDSAGRLIRPSHKRGSYESFARLWDIVYEGLWENDFPLKKKGTRKKKGKRKCKNEKIFTLTASINEKLRNEMERVQKQREEKQNMINTMSSLLNEMEKNNEEMRMWKNVALAHDFFDILGKIPDATALDKAEVCDMLLSHIPEYDVPRYALQIAKEQLGWLQTSQEKSEIVSLEAIQAYINRLEDYIDYENISNEEFMQKHDKMLNFDPIRRTPLWEENICRWEEECDRRLGDAPRGMGFCFGYWNTFADVLREEGIEWRSPHQMNPGVMFD